MDITNDLAIIMRIIFQTVPETGRQTIVLSIQIIILYLHINGIHANMMKYFVLVETIFNNLEVFDKKGTSP